MAGCITLLSDIGSQDATLAAIKGVFLQEAPQSTLIDISHDLDPFYIQQAAYVLSSSYKYYPQNTVHIVLYDVYASEKPRMLLTQKEGQYFIAPDNGILPLIFGSELSLWECYTFSAETDLKVCISALLKVINKLRNTSLPEAGLTDTHTNITPIRNIPKSGANTIECEIIYIDRFENVVLNLKQEEFEEVKGERGFEIRIMREEAISKIHKHYNDVSQGNVLCRFNSAGYLEIAVNRGNAASLFGFRINKEQNHYYNTIKIFFE